MILLIDNYDSFTYNLVQELGTLEKEIRTVRNDQISIEEIRQLAPSHLVLSPGPGYPKDAGICEEVIRSFQGQIPILGICLGHQAICEVYSAKSHLQKNSCTERKAGSCWILPALYSMDWEGRPGQPDTILWQR